MEKTVTSKQTNLPPQTIANTPWNSIAESIVPPTEGEKSLSEALESPCLSCSTSPCCTHLPLNSFKITNLSELDYAHYLLNFERIELGLSANGEWSSYYCYPCRYLDRRNFLCTVHNQPNQPQICVTYNPYQCWYKRVFTKSLTEEFIRIDRLRLERILSHLVFDEDRRLIKIPDWQTIMDSVSEIPLELAHPFSEYSPHDPMLELWQQQLLEPHQGETGTKQGYNIYELKNPCRECQAYCCQNLIFPQHKPLNYSNLDYLRFALGFPGAALGIADEGWSLVLKVTCRHLSNYQCAIYGQPDRPLICRYYDEWKCTYKERLGQPRPAGFFRIKLEHFQWLLECFQFDASGNIVFFPSTEEIRHHIEACWQAQISSPNK